VKSRRLATHPIVAAFIAGVALWVTRASFDVAGTTEAPVRVAMMPSMAELLGLVVMSLLIAAGMALLVRTDPGQPYWEPISEALMPLTALAFLFLPYLPWLADWIPALRLLAGPGRLLLWVVVAGQVLWIFLPQVAARLGARSSLLSATQSAVVFACVAVFLTTPFLANAGTLREAVGGFLEAIRNAPSAQLSNLSGATFGSLFDQEFGILSFAPVLVFGFIGLGAMVRDGSTRRLGVGLLVATLALIVLSGTIDPWWRRSFAPGRPLLLLLPLLVIPIAFLYSRLPRPSWARAGAQVLLLLSLGITAIVWVFVEDVPVQQDGDGASSLLRWLSPTWQLWSELPSYVEGSSLEASARAGLWIAAFAIVAWFASRTSRRSSEGRTALLVTAGFAAVLLAVPSVTAALRRDERTRFDIEGRGLVPLLETFDPVARPIAVRYDAFSVVQPQELPPLFALSAVPGQRTGRQPLRVVLNARFRLPAGSYELDLKGADSAGTVPDAAIFLQLGREGGALISWPLTMTPGGHEQHRFDVPVDSEFVAFRAAPSVEPTIAAMRITPLSVVETRKRLLTPSVLSASSFGAVTAFFHGGAYPEPDGFWVKGRAATRVTLLKTRTSETEIPLAVHSGSRANVVTLSTPEWSQQLQLVPGVTQRVTVPTNSGDKFIPLTITATDGFVPAELGPSRDRRLLGAWIAVVPSLPDAVPTALPPH
jgi:hypothetical protein